MTTSLLLFLGVVFLAAITISCSLWEFSLFMLALVIAFYLLGG